MKLDNLMIYLCKKAAVWGCIRRTFYRKMEEKIEIFKKSCTFFENFFHGEKTYKILYNSILNRFFLLLQVHKNYHFKKKLTFFVILCF